MKIKLIAPHEQNHTAISGAKTFKFQRINLPLLAALTPSGHGLTMADEAFTLDTSEKYF